MSTNPWLPRPSLLYEAILIDFGNECVSKSGCDTIRIIAIVIVNKE